MSALKRKPTLSYPPRNDKICSPCHHSHRKPTNNTPRNTEYPRSINNVSATRYPNQRATSVCCLCHSMLSISSLGMANRLRARYPRPKPFPGYGCRDPTRSMKYFRDILEHVSMTEKLGVVLQQAFDRCYRREGYGELRVHNTFLPPRRDGFHRVYFEVSH
jgi:hypothetical protein